MADHVVLLVVMGSAQLAYSLVALWTWPARNRAGAEILAALLHAAGPGGVVETAAPDGSVVIVRTAPVAEPREPAEVAR